MFRKWGEMRGGNVRERERAGDPEGRMEQNCQMAKFDPFLSLDCARVEGVGVQTETILKIKL